jgi:hypothetical protein
MSENERLKNMSRDERIAFCREVMDNLSDLVEGEAPADFCERVDEILGDCQPFNAYRNTLEATIDLAGECGDTEAEFSQVDEDAFLRCVERVRGKLSS